MALLDLIAAFATTDSSQKAAWRQRIYLPDQIGIRVSTHHVRNPVTEDILRGEIVKVTYPSARTVRINSGVLQGSVVGKLLVVILMLAIHKMGRLNQSEDALLAAKIFFSIFLIFNELFFFLFFFNPYHALNKIACEIIPLVQERQCFSSVDEKHKHRMASKHFETRYWTVESPPTPPPPNIPVRSQWERLAL